MTTLSQDTMKQLEAIFEENGLCKCGTSKTSKNFAYHVCSSRKFREAIAQLISSEVEKAKKSTANLYKKEIKIYKAFQDAVVKAEQTMLTPPPMLLLNVKDGTISRLSERNTDEQ